MFVARQDMDGVEIEFSDMLSNFPAFRCTLVLESTSTDFAPRRKQIFSNRTRESVFFDSHFSENLSFST
jgi:hypothetical protein